MGTLIRENKRKIALSLNMGLLLMGKRKILLRYS